MVGVAISAVFKIKKVCQRFKAECLMLHIDTFSCNTFQASEPRSCIFPV